MILGWILASFLGSFGTVCLVAGVRAREELLVLSSLILFGIFAVMLTHGLLA